MKDRKPEFLLIAVALMVCSFIILFSLFDSPKYNDVRAANIPWSDTTKKTTLPATDFSENDKININTADAQELMKLHNIGEKKAEAIIEYRERNGKFRSVDELENVDGISKSIIEKNADRITF